MKNKLVFILSSNYSGSHFFSLLLGSHSKAEHLGELKNLYKGQESRPCYICNDLEGCKLFHSVNEQPKNKVYQILFDRVSPDVEMLVDASKKVKWFKHFVADDRYDIRLIHLIRDPRALVRRWLMRFDEQGIGRRERIKLCRKYPYKTAFFLSCDLLEICIHKWCAQNKEFVDFLEKTKLPSKVVSYKQIALDTDSTLSEVSNWLGVDYELQQKSYWDFEHHGTQKHEYEWVRQQGGAQYFDQRWKDFLSEEQAHRIENHALVQKLLKKLGLVFCDQGLEASST